MVIAMFSNGSREMFTPVPAISGDGSVTSIGAGACMSERREAAARLILRSEGSFRGCAGQFFRNLELWASRQDVIAVVCTDEDELVVLADGTLWARSEGKSPFRLAADCSPQWYGRIEPCLEFGDSVVTMGAPVDLCSFRSGSTDAHD
jgi:hypothetical protein